MGMEIHRVYEVIMDMFENLEGKPKNLLPKDGVVNYYGVIMPESLANKYLTELLKNIEWKNDEVILHGKHIITKRKIAWYGDKAFKYTYSNTTKHALLWTNELLTLKTIVEEQSGETYNSCLLNLYHNGSEGMAWHSDAEKVLTKHAAIASLSFGAERKFSFKHKKSKETASLILEQGSLLVMKGDTQTHWLHSLPITTKTHLARINLTFRKIID